MIDSKPFNDIKGFSIFISNSRNRQNKGKYKIIERIIIDQETDAPEKDA